MEDATTVSCATALLDAWISRFGLPEHITSDRGSVFISDIWSSLAQLLGVHLHHTTSYHPQANGMVERWHRTLKASLTARCSTSDWCSQLPWVLLGLRTLPKDSLIHSSAEMVYGQPLVVPGEFFPYDSTTDQSHVETLRRIVTDLAPCRPSKQHQHTTSYVPAELKSSDYMSSSGRMLTNHLYPTRTEAHTGYLQEQTRATAYSCTTEKIGYPLIDSNQHILTSTTTTAM